MVVDVAEVVVVADDVAKTTRTALTIEINCAFMVEGRYDLLE